MDIFYQFDTICAIATPFGIGGIGVIRISGEKSFEIINKIFSKKIEKEGIIYHGWIIDNNEKIDEVIILPFKNPNSYTGENVIEIQCHGGIHNINNIIDILLKNGAKIAQKGEFTKRAFLNHKMDLSKAEAVLDIIHAKTSKFAKQSVKNLAGVLTNEILKIRKEIFDLLSKIIAGIDFPEDVEEPSYEFIAQKIEEIISSINKILKNAKNSNIMRQGIKVAIVGCPNVGKSSLFNELLSINRAIVTEIAGTTRDIIQETIDIEGIPLTLIDTAGIRNCSNIDKVEKIGIDYSKETLEYADLVLFLYDSSIGYTKQDDEIFKLIKNKNYIKIATKSDIAFDKKDINSLYVSIFKNNNIKQLKNKILSKILENNAEIEFVTNQRQQDCLNNALNSLSIALKTTKESQLQDLISIDIKSALIALDEISGEVITDNILNNIFDNFCIGK